MNENKKNLNNFTQRTITGIILATVFYLIIRYIPIPYFSLIVLLITTGAAIELIKLAKPTVYSPPIIFLNGLTIALYFTFGKPDLPLATIIILFANGLFFLFSIKDNQQLPAFVRDISLHFLVVFYIYFPLYYMYKLKELHPNYLFFLVSVIAIGDSFAYFIGRPWGKHKIYPIASPKKSLEGLIASIVFAGLTALLAIWVFPVPVKWWMAMITGAITGLFSQLSDPIESLFKRAAHQKDSSSLIPGHGGILDRVDSYIFCAPVLYYIILVGWR